MSKIQKKQLDFILKQYFVKYDIEELGTIWVDLNNISYSKKSTVREIIDSNSNKDEKMESDEKKSVSNDEKKSSSKKKKKK